jgi:hypothetical protein
MKTEESAGEAARKVPARLEATRERFDAWRRTRPTKACPIPPVLWAAAAGCARQYGSYRTALVLGLDSGKLKRKADAGGKPAGKKMPAFVELAPARACAPAECVLEVESRAGSRLRIHLKGTSLGDLAELARSFAGERA